MAGHNPHTIAHEAPQTLSNIEDVNLVRWITRLTRTGISAILKLVLEMVEEIRRECVQPSGQSTSIGRPIGYPWLDRFKSVILRSLLFGLVRLKARDSTERIMRLYVDIWTRSPSS